MAKHMMPITRYGLAKFSGLERKVIRQHLHVLLEADFVQSIGTGFCSRYVLNKDNPTVDGLIHLFRSSGLLIENDWDRQSYRPLESVAATG
jgi:hypothetical protein